MYTIGIVGNNINTPVVLMSVQAKVVEKKLLIYFSSSFNQLHVPMLSSDDRNTLNKTGIEYMRKFAVNVAFFRKITKT